MKTVVFDLDGTLVDTAADIARAVNVVLARRDVPPQAPEFVERFTGHGPYGLIAGVYSALAIHVADAELAGDVEQYLAAAREDPAAESTLFADAATALPQLVNRGAALGICTNKTEDMARRVLTALGVDHYFGAVVGADTIAVHKPDPEHLLETIRRLGGDPATTLYLGDSPTDLKTGDRAGVTTWLVDWSELVDPGRTRIANFSELLTAMQGAPA